MVRIICGIIGILILLGLVVNGYWGLLVLFALAFGIGYLIWGRPRRSTPPSGE